MTPPAVEKPFKRRASTAAVLGLICFVVYLTNLRPPGAADSLPTRLMPFSLLRQGNLDLDEFSWLRRLEARPYFVRQTSGGHVISRYPAATAVFALPFALPAVWWLEHNQIEDDDVRFRLATLVVERLTAAAISAASVALVFLALCRLASPGIAIAMALTYAFGSSIWSIGSQALWQHELAALSLAGLSLALIAPDTRRNAVVGGLFAALAAAARPTMVIFTLLALVFVWRERRRSLLAFVALPALGAVILLAYNLREMGSILGGYAGMHIDGPSARALSGLLISPNRGLLVFTPAAALSLVGFYLWREQGSRWIIYLGVGFAAYVLFYGSSRAWWGGSTYGPRFLVDVLPALALAAVPVVERLARSTWGRVVMGILVLWGIAVQVIGVYGNSYEWNQLPRAVTVRRVNDWSDLQILRTLRAPWKPAPLAAVLWQAITTSQPAYLRQMSAEDLAGEVAVDGSLPLRFRAGQPSRLPLRVTNKSNVNWPGYSDYGYLDCEVVYVWEPAPAGFRRVSWVAPFPRNVAPGETVHLSGALAVPRRRGSYHLRIALVQLLDSGHGVAGNAEITVPVEVE